VQPLDYRNEEIRLVTLNPGHFADDIHCSLSKVSLKDGLSYEALMLGAPQPPHVKYFSVDYTIVLPISWSLRFGIYDMSLNRECCGLMRCASIRETFWSEILKANEWYVQESWEVIAWLGEELEDSNFAFDAFEAMRKVDQMHWDLKTHPMLKEVLINPKYTTAICELFQRSWWHRVWTVQESVLGRTLRFVCGSGRSLQTYYSQLRKVI
jgi:hypothetical protein